MLLRAKTGTVIRLSKVCFNYLWGRWSGIDRRLAGWSIKNKESLDDAPLFGNERPLILTNDKDIEALIAYIEHRIEIDGAPALIVVDTLARALGAADERAGADINKLIAALSEIIAQYDCTILLVHHTGHSAAAQNRARGASELPLLSIKSFASSLTTRLGS